jgi:hypothetical protein
MTISFILSVTMTCFDLLVILRWFYEYMHGYQNLHLKVNVFSHLKCVIYK